MAHLLRVGVAAVALGMAPWAAFAQSRAGAITVRDVLAVAREQSPARRAALARLEGAELSHRLSGRVPGPLAEVRWENWAPGHPLPLDAFAAVTQTVELGGKRPARVGVAGATAASARASLTATERDLDADIVGRFLAVVRTRDRHRILAAHRDGLSELVRVLERRVAEGVTAESDLRKIEAERERVDTEAALADVRARHELASLGALVGWSPAPSIDALERPTLPPPDEEAGLGDAAIARRADVQVAAARLDAARQTLRFERARRVPDLAVTGGLKRTAGFSTGVLAVQVPVPLSDRNQAALALARGQLAAAELDFAQTRRLAQAEAAALLDAARELARRGARAEASLVGPATVVRLAARAAFTSGAGDLLRLVDAERVFADAEMAVSDLALDAAQAAFDARLAMGKELMP